VAEGRPQNDRRLTAAAVTAAARSAPGPERRLPGAPPAESTELAGVTADVDPAAFTITPAPGVRVVPSGPPGWLAGSPGEIARGAAKGAARAAAELGIRWMQRYQP